jgi:hypothetical protein
VPRVRPILSLPNRYLAAAILLVAFNLMVSAGRAYPSCWAENPTGGRTCGFFKSGAGNLDLWLCEDDQGDCAKLGYIPSPPQQIEAPLKSSVERARPSPSTQESPIHSRAILRERKAEPPEPIAKGTSIPPKSVGTATESLQDHNAAPTSTDPSFALFFCILLVGGAAFALGWLLESRR